MVKNKSALCFDQLAGPIEMTQMSKEELAVNDSICRLLFLKASCLKDSLQEYDVLFSL